MKSKVVFTALAVSIVFAGCSREDVPSQPVGISPARPVQSLLGQSVNSLLYVGNYQRSGSNVLVFSDLGKTLKRTVALPYAVAEGVAVDVRGDLFAASGNAFNLKQQSITVFKDAGAKAVKTLPQRFPFEGLTTDGSGNLFIGCGQAAHRLCQYPPANRRVISGRIVRRINLDLYGVSATNLTTDASGDVAVSDQNHVSVFAPGSKQPYMDMALGLFVGGVAFDQSGNLYVALTGTYDRNSISVYAPGNTKPIRSFSIPTSRSPAQVLAFDAAGNLYALLPQENGPAVVLVFPPNGSYPTRTISKGLENFKNYPTMAVDPAGDVYVADRGTSSTTGSIVVYAAGQSKPRRVITAGIQSPGSIAVGP